MAKLGAITSNISQELEYALEVMQEFGLHYAELQYVWNKEVGDLDDAEVARAQSLVAQHAVKVCCISRHIFAGLLIGQTEVGGEAHNRQMTSLRRCIDMAKALDCGLVRIMSFHKEMILFGSGGAEIWNVTKGAWDKLKLLIEPAVALAEDQCITLVVETGNNGMISSGYLARKLIDELRSKHLKILWDPANSLYSNEPAYPDGYEAVRGEYLGHIHLKDCRVDIPKATVDQCRFGEGQMAPFFGDIAHALTRDNFQGVAALEGVYRPAGKTFEAGLRESISEFKRIFA
ncbi:MAG: sugar phosphate isomerase/epimerase family protein [Candidatus Acidiferrales bacterium]